MTRFSPPTLPRLPTALCLGAALALCGSGAAQDGVEWSEIGFAASNVGQQLEIERLLLESIPADGFRTHLRELTKEPHVAGTASNRRVANYLAQEMAEAGLEVRRYPYDVYLPLAESATSRVEIVRPRRELLNQQEDIVKGDRFSDHQALGPGWNAFSASGDATGAVVYANYGRREDFEQLRRLGIEVGGKIVIARYGGNFRGYKAKFAEEAGAVGLLIYSDPADGGYTQGLEYPEGRHLNDSTVQRGSILALSWRGDALTPFEPALPRDDSSVTVQRKDPSEVGLPGIPVTPLPHRSAQRILSQMTGASVPRDWQGGLALPYRLEGGPELTVRVAVKQPKDLVRIENVVGVVRGRELPEEWIIFGSHYDAWGFGALDPNGGTAMLLTMADALGELVRKGHRPRRSILIAHWDAEEFGIIGSGEWVEQMSRELDAKAVAYINADGAVTGPQFSASASPSLKAVIRETTESVRLPDGSSIHENWAGLDGGEPFGDLGGGSDHVGFYCHLGIPSAMVGFSGPAPIYHSNYDNLAWFERFADPDWTIGTTLTQLDGVLALRLANADLLPYDFGSLAEDASRHLAVAERTSGRSLRRARVRLAKLVNSADRLDRVRRRALVSATAAQRDFAEANAELLRVERLLLHPDGMPYGAWYRSLFASPDPFSGYAPWMFPGLRWAAEEGSVEDLERWQDIYAEALQRLTSAADRIAQTLR